MLNGLSNWPVDARRFLYAFWYCKYELALPFASFVVQKSVLLLAFMCFISWLYKVFKSERDTGHFLLSSGVFLQHYTTMFNIHKKKKIERNENAIEIAP
jgi:hypothetical protein